MRGCQKRMIQVKNMSSTIFDEAYFILREDAALLKKSDADMVREAGRIIEENQISLKKRKTKERHSWFSFLLGALCAAVSCSALWWAISMW